MFPKLTPNRNYEYHTIHLSTRVLEIVFRLLLLDIWHIHYGSFEPITCMLLMQSGTVVAPDNASYISFFSICAWELSNSHSEASFGLKMTHWYQPTGPPRKTNIYPPLTSLLMTTGLTSVCHQNPIYIVHIHCSGHCNFLNSPQPLLFSLCDYHTSGLSCLISQWTVHNIQWCEALYITCKALEIRLPLPAALPNPPLWFDNIFYDLTNVQTSQTWTYIRQYQTIAFNMNGWITTSHSILQTFEVVYADLTDTPYLLVSCLPATNAEILGHILQNALPRSGGEFEPSNIQRLLTMPIFQSMHVLGTEVRDAIGAERASSTHFAFPLLKRNSSSPWYLSALSLEGKLEVFQTEFTAAQQSKLSKAMRRSDKTAAQGTSLAPAHVKASTKRSELKDKIETARPTIPSPAPRNAWTTPLSVHARSRIKLSEFLNPEFESKLPPTIIPLRIGLYHPITEEAIAIPLGWLLGYSKAKDTRADTLLRGMRGLQHAICCTTSEELAWCYDHLGIPLGSPIPQIHRILNRLLVVEWVHSSNPAKPKEQTDNLRVSIHGPKALLLAADLLMTMLLRRLAPEATDIHTGALEGTTVYLMGLPFFFQRVKPLGKQSLTQVMKSTAITQMEAIYRPACRLKFHERIINLHDQSGIEALIMHLCECDPSLAEQIIVLGCTDMFLPLEASAETALQCYFIEFSSPMYKLIAAGIFNSPAFSRFLSLYQLVGLASERGKSGLTQAISISAPHWSHATSTKPSLAPAYDEHFPDGLQHVDMGIQEQITVCDTGIKVPASCIRLWNERDFNGWCLLAIACLIRGISTAVDNYSPLQMYSGITNILSQFNYLIVPEGTADVLTDLKHLLTGLKKDMERSHRQQGTYTWPSILPGSGGDISLDIFNSLTQHRIAGFLGVGEHLSPSEVLNMGYAYQYYSLSGSHQTITQILNPSFTLVNGRYALPILCQTNRHFRFATPHDITHSRAIQTAMSAKTGYTCTVPSWTDMKVTFGMLPTSLGARWNGAHPAARTDTLEPAHVSSGHLDDSMADSAISDVEKTTIVRHGRHAPEEPLIFTDAKGAFDRFTTPNSPRRTGEHAAPGSSPEPAQMSTAPLADYMVTQYLPAESEGTTVSCTREASSRIPTYALPTRCMNVTLDMSTTHYDSTSTKLHKAASVNTLEPAHVSYGHLDDYMADSDISDVQKNTIVRHGRKVAFNTSEEPRVSTDAKDTFGLLTTPHSSRWSSGHTAAPGNSPEPAFVSTDPLADYMVTQYMSDEQEGTTVSCTREASSHILPSPARSNTQVSPGMSPTHHDSRSNELRKVASVNTFEPAHAYSDLLDEYRVAQDMTGEEEAALVGHKRKVDSSSPMDAPTFAMESPTRRYRTRSSHTDVSIRGEPLAGKKAQPHSTPERINSRVTHIDTRQRKFILRIGYRIINSEIFLAYNDEFICGTVVRSMAPFAIASPQDPYLHYYLPSVPPTNTTAKKSKGAAAARRLCLAPAHADSYELWKQFHKQLDTNCPIVATPMNASENMSTVAAPAPAHAAPVPSDRQLGRLATTDGEMILPPDEINTNDGMNPSASAPYSRRRETPPLTNWFQSIASDTRAHPQAAPTTRGCPDIGSTQDSALLSSANNTTATIMPALPSCVPLTRPSKHADDLGDTTVRSCTNWAENLGQPLESPLWSQTGGSQTSNSKGVRPKPSSQVSSHCEIVSQGFHIPSLLMDDLLPDQHGILSLLGGPKPRKKIQTNAPYPHPLFHYQSVPIGLVDLREILEDFPSIIDEIDNIPKSKLQAVRSDRNRMMVEVGESPDMGAQLSSLPLLSYFLLGVRTHLLAMQLIHPAAIWKITLLIPSRDGNLADLQLPHTDEEWEIFPSNEDREICRNHYSRNDSIIIGLGTHHATELRDTIVDFAKDVAQQLHRTPLHERFKIQIKETVRVHLLPGQAAIFSSAAVHMGPAEIHGGTYRVFIHNISPSWPSPYLKKQTRAPKAYIIPFDRYTQPPSEHWFLTSQGQVNKVDHKAWAEPWVQFIPRSDYDVVFSSREIIEQHRSKLERLLIDPSVPKINNWGFHPLTEVSNYQDLPYNPSTTVITDHPGLTLSSAGIFIDGFGDMHTESNHPEHANTNLALNQDMQDELVYPTFEPLDADSAMEIIMPTHLATNISQHDCSPNDTLSQSWTPIHSSDSALRTPAHHQLDQPGTEPPPAVEESADILMDILSHPTIVTSPGTSPLPRPRKTRRGSRAARNARFHKINLEGYLAYTPSHIALIHAQRDDPKLRLMDTEQGKVLTTASNCTYAPGDLIWYLPPGAGNDLLISIPDPRNAMLSIWIRTRNSRYEYGLLTDKERARHQAFRPQHRDPAAYLWATGDLSRANCCFDLTTLPYRIVATKWILAETPILYFDNRIPLEALRNDKYHVTNGMVDERVIATPLPKFHIPDIRASGPSVQWEEYTQTVLSTIAFQSIPDLASRLQMFLGPIFDLFIAVDDDTLASFPSIDGLNLLRTIYAYNLMKPYPSHINGDLDYNQPIGRAHLIKTLKHFGSRFYYGVFPCAVPDLYHDKLAMRCADLARSLKKHPLTKPVVNPFNHTDIMHLVYNQYRIRDDAEWTSTELYVRDDKCFQHTASSAAVGEINWQFLMHWIPGRDCSKRLVILHDPSPNKYWINLIYWRQLQMASLRWFYESIGTGLRRNRVLQAALYERYSTTEEIIKELQLAKGFPSNIAGDGPHLPDQDLASTFLDPLSGCKLVTILGHNIQAVNTYLLAKQLPATAHTIVEWLLLPDSPFSFTFHIAAGVAHNMMYHATPTDGFCGLWVLLRAIYWHHTHAEPPFALNLTGDGGYAISKLLHLLTKTTQTNLPRFAKLQLKLAFVWRKLLNKGLMDTPALWDDAGIDPYRIDFSSFKDISCPEYMELEELNLALQLLHLRYIIWVPAHEGPVEHDAESLVMGSYYPFGLFDPDPDIESVRPSSFRCLLQTLLNQDNIHIAFDRQHYYLIADSTDLLHGFISVAAQVVQNMAPNGSQGSLLDTSTSNFNDMYLKHLILGGHPNIVPAMSPTIQNERGLIRQADSSFRLNTPLARYSPRRLTLLAALNLRKDPAVNSSTYAVSHPDDELYIVDGRNHIPLGFIGPLTNDLLGNSNSYQSVVRFTVHPREGLQTWIVASRSLKPGPLATELSFDYGQPYWMDRMEGASPELLSAILNKFTVTSYMPSPSPLEPLHWTTEKVFASVRTPHFLDLSSHYTTHGEEHWSALTRFNRRIRTPNLMESQYAQRPGTDHRNDPAPADAKRLGDQSTRNTIHLTAQAGIINNPSTLSSPSHTTDAKPWQDESVKPKFEQYSKTPTLLPRPFPGKWSGWIYNPQYIQWGLHENSPLSTNERDILKQRTSGTILPTLGLSYHSPNSLYVEPYELDAEVINWYTQETIQPKLRLVPYFKHKHGAVTELLALRPCSTIMKGDTILIPCGRPTNKRRGTHIHYSKYGYFETRKVYHDYGLLTTTCATVPPNFVNHIRYANPRYPSLHANACWDCTIADFPKLVALRNITATEDETCLILLQPDSSFNPPRKMLIEPGNLDDCETVCFPKPRYSNQHQSTDSQEFLQALPSPSEHHRLHQSTVPFRFQSLHDYIGFGTLNINGKSNDALLISTTLNLMLSEHLYGFAFVDTRLRYADMRVHRQMIASISPAGTIIIPYPGRPPDNTEGLSDRAQLVGGITLIFLPRDGIRILSKSIDPYRLGLWVKVIVQHERGKITWIPCYLPHHSSMSNISNNSGALYAKLATCLQPTGDTNKADSSGESPMEWIIRKLAAQMAGVYGTHDDRAILQGDFNLPYLPDGNAKFPLIDTFRDMGLNCFHRQLLDEHNISPLTFMQGYKDISDIDHCLTSTPKHDIVAGGIGHHNSWFAIGLDHKPIWIGLRITSTLNPISRALCRLPLVTLNATDGKGDIYRSNAQRWFDTCVGNDDHHSPNYLFTPNISPSQAEVQLEFVTYGIAAHFSATYTNSTPRKHLKRRDLMESPETAALNLMLAFYVEVHRLIQEDVSNPNDIHLQETDMHSLAQSYALDISGILAGDGNALAQPSLDFNTGHSLLSFWADVSRHEAVLALMTDYDIVRRQTHRKYRKYKSFSIKQHVLKREELVA